ncbi:TPA: class I SAM-dependent methyltransferase [bacterium]|nr:class I SAM-dependent methyltransferase [bacterium]
MKQCIACGKDHFPVRDIKVYDPNTKRDYYIEFCICGLGKTRIDDTSVISEVNIEIYNSIETRIKLYYNKLYNHLIIRHNQSLRTIRMYTHAKRYLEVGSNIGFTAKLSKNFGYDVTACEINNNCRWFSENVYGLKTENNFYTLTGEWDIVTFFDVLEHFPEPEKALEKLNEILSLNGVVFVQLPNSSSKGAKREKEKWSYYAPPDHIYHFTPHSLITFFERHDFECKWIREVNTIDDFLTIRILPSLLRKKIVDLIYMNPFYYPGFYKRKSGSLIQSVFMKKK